MKVGDRVRIIDDSSYYKTGAEGIILNIIHEGDSCLVKFDTGDYDKSINSCWYVNKESLEIISYPIVPEAKVNKQRFWAVVANEKIYQICHTRQEARDLRTKIIDRHGIFKTKKVSIRKVDISILKEKV